MALWPTKTFGRNAIHAAIDTALPLPFGRNRRQLPLDPSDVGHRSRGGVRTAARGIRLRFPDNIAIADPEDCGPVKSQ
jgi:hypothetical protein